MKIGYLEILVLIDSLFCINWSLVFGSDLVSVSPLPVVVPIVVNFLDRDRCLRWDVVRELIRTFFAIAFFSLLEASLAIFVRSQCLGVAGYVLELIWR